LVSDDLSAVVGSAGPGYARATTVQFRRVSPQGSADRSARPTCAGIPRGI